MRYLNKYIKEDIIVMDALCDHITARLTEWQNIKLMQNERKLIGMLKQAVSLIRNSLHKYLEQFSDEERQQMIRKKSQNELYILPKSDFVLKQESELMHHRLTNEMAAEISEGIIEGFCRKCTCTDYKACTKRELMMNWLIPPAHEDTDQCQYKY